MMDHGRSQYQFPKLPAQLPPRPPLRAPGLVKNRAGLLRVAPNGLRAASSLGSRRRPDPPPRGPVASGYPRGHRQSARISAREQDRITLGSGESDETFSMFPVHGHERGVASDVRSADHDPSLALHPGMGLELPRVVFGNADMETGRVTLPFQQQLDGQGLREARSASRHVPACHGHGPGDPIGGACIGPVECSGGSRSTSHEATEGLKRQQPQPNADCAELDGRPDEEDTLRRGQEEDFTQAVHGTAHGEFRSANCR